MVLKQSLYESESEYKYIRIINSNIKLNSTLVNGIIVKL